MAENIPTDLTTWTPPIVSDNFYQNFATFLQLHQDEQTTKMRAQYLYSHILMNEQWEQAKVWIGPNGEIFENEGAIPSYLVAVTSLQAQFPSLNVFVEWCEANIKGFAWSSYRDRHYIIMELLGRNHDLITAVEFACMSRAVPEAISKVFEYSSDRNKTVVGVNDELVKRLPTLTVAPGDYDALSEEERIEVAKESAKRYDEEKLAALREGILPAQVSAITKREIERKPLIVVIFPDDERYPYAIQHTKWGADDNGYDEGEITTVYVQFIDTDTGELIEELPPSIKEWWEKKFKLGGHRGSRTRFAWHG